MKTFFWSSPKINEKKVTAFRYFQTAPPKKSFLCPFPRTHYSGAGPASNCLIRPKQAHISTLVPYCIFAVFLVRFFPPYYQLIITKLQL